jgi:uncharacterized membrane protein required for colicin V production
VGIAIDILVVLFLLWSLIRGWRVGFLYQLGLLAFLVLAYFASRGLASILDKSVAKMLELSPLVAGTVTFFVIFFVLGLVGAIIVRRITKDLVPDQSSLSSVNRFLGAGVSLAKGALIAYLVIVVLLQIQRIAGDTPFPWQTSVAARFVAKHNFLDRGELGALVKLGWLVSTRDLAELSQDPRAQKLMSHPKAHGLYTPEVLSAIRNQDYVALFRNDALWDYLAEREVQETLDSFDWFEDDRPQPAAPYTP